MAIQVEALLVAACDECETEMDQADSDLANFVAILREAGWTVTADFDCYCPECRPEKGE